MGVRKTGIDIPEVSGRYIAWNVSLDEFDAGRSVNLHSHYHYYRCLRKVAAVRFRLSG